MSDSRPPENRSSPGDARRRPHHGDRHAGRRKERVLHTRVSEPLAEEIRRIAEDLRVPVSNLVRNVLEEAFNVMEAVSENVGDFIDDVVDEAERTRGRIHHRRHALHRRRRRAGCDADAGFTGEPAADAAARAPRAEFPEVIGWQPLILNQPRACADCEEPIERSERGFAGMTATGPSEHYLCRDCMNARH